MNNISNEDFSPVYEFQSSDVNAAYEKLTEIFTTCFSSLPSKQNCKINTSGILRSVNNTNKMYRKLRKQPFNI